jgi:hypothetical protein
MIKTANSVQQKIQAGASRAGKRPEGGAKGRRAPASSRRGEGVRPYWWILRGCRPDES